MHEIGAAMSMKQTGSDGVVKRIIKEDFYDFNFQDFVPGYEWDAETGAAAFQISAGDSLETV